MRSESAKASKRENCEVDAIDSASLSLSKVIVALNIIKRKERDEREERVRRDREKRETKKE
jgi:hypothetical protein